MQTETHIHLETLSARFDAFIIDLWGVLHDGHSPYDGALECLTKLHEAGKEIILLSNAPRRCQIAEDRLTELGFPRHLYKNVLTSGELTYQQLKKQFAVPTPYVYIGPEKDRSLLHSTECVEVSEPKQAESALVTGYENFGDAFESKLPETKAALEAGLTLYCANPDRQVVRQDGAVQPCAGLLGEWYEKQGGRVIWFGKPYDAAYHAVLAQFITKNRAKIAAIGDSFHTDTAGANKAGLYSILCAGGIYKKALGLPEAHTSIQDADFYNKNTLESLALSEQAVPHAIIPAFVW